MRLRDLMGPRNRRVRLLVGLLLVGLFCVQCTRIAFRPSKWIQPVDSKVRFLREASASPEGGTTGNRIEELARTDHLALLEECQEHYRNTIGSYTCTLVKQERIKGVLGKEQTVSVKFMGKPFSVAMAWTENPGQGDRVLYVEGQRGDKMVVRPANGLLRALAGGSVLVDPRDKAARSASLRTVDQFGFERSLQNLVDVYRQAHAEGHLKQEFGGYASVAGRRTIVLIRHLPAENDYPAAKSVIFIDLEHLIPIAVEGYGWNAPDELICRYVYKDIVLNAPLTDDDFLPENNDIKGRK